VVRLGTRAEDARRRRRTLLSGTGREAHPQADGCRLHRTGGATALAAPVLVLWLVGVLGFASARVGGVTTAAHTSAYRRRWVGMGNKGSVGSIGGCVHLVHLLHEKHAPSVEEGGQWVHHGDDGGAMAN
jgi:hypothetical protein